MKRSREKDIKATILQKIWNEYKNEFTMRELAKILGIPMPTFYRALKRKIKYEK